MRNDLYEICELVATEGPVKGRFPLAAGDNVIGRGTEARVVLDDAAVSRAHTSISVGTEIRIEDMGSAQGTYLNGRLLVGSDFLFDADEIRIGPCTLRIQVKRREGRMGILVGLMCLLVACVVCVVALLRPGMSATEPAASAAQAAVPVSGADAGQPAWLDWESLTLPTRPELERDHLAIEPRTAQAEFALAGGLYDDRLVDLGNAYRGILHYKRALSIALMLPPLSRPAVIKRSIDRITELRELMRSACEKRVFACRRACEMLWWDEAYRNLHEVQTISPSPHCRYNRWAGKEIERLDRMLQP